MELEDQIVALTALQSRIKDELDKKRKAWLEKARPKSRDTAMIGDAELGSVSWRKGATRWTLTDKEALIQWAQANATHLIDYGVFIPDHHLAALKKNPVTEDGEVIPGFEVSESEPGVTVKPVPDAGRVIENAVAEGQLSWSEVLEIES